MTEKASDGLNQFKSPGKGVLHSFIATWSDYPVFNISYHLL